MNNQQSSFMSDLDSVDTAVDMEYDPQPIDTGPQLELSSHFVYQHKSQKVPRDLDPKKLKLNPVETYSIKYVLTPEQLATIEEQAPYKRFRYEPVKPHDHGVSHIWYSLNERSVIETFKGQPFVDLHGRATRNADLKTNATIYRGRYNTRDYMRWTEDGNTVKDLISVEWAIKQNPNTKYWYSNHSAYYMSLEEIGAIVYSNSQAEFHAIVHRHDRLKGTLNGELTYVVDEYGYVQQFTPLGEKYEHPTFEPYFHQHEAKCSKGVITWTTHKLGGDAYHIKFVAAPGYHKEVRALALPDLAAKAKPIIKVETPDYQVKSVFGYEWITFKEHKEVILDNIPLFERLCKFIANKDRNETTMKDLSLYARRLTDKNDLFAKHSHEWFDIPHEHMVWYVQAAFYADIENEITAMLAHRRKYRNKVQLHQKLKDSITAKESTIRGTISDAVDAVVTASSQALDSVTYTGQLAVSGVDKLVQSGLKCAAPQMMPLSDAHLKHLMASGNNKPPDPSDMVKRLT